MEMMIALFRYSKSLLLGFSKSDLRILIKATLVVLLNVLHLSMQVF